MPEQSETSSEDRIQDTAAAKQDRAFCRQGGSMWGLVSVAVGALGLVWALAGAALVAIPLALVALGCGVLGWKYARQHYPAGRRDVAVVGATLGVLALFSGGVRGMDGSETSDVSSDSPRAGPLPGETIQLGTVDVTVTDVSSASEEGPATTAADVIVTYKLNNLTGSDQVFDKSAQVVYVGGQPHPASAQGTLEVSDSATMLLTLKPGATTRSKIAFSMAKPATVTAIGVVSSDGMEQIVAVP